MEITDMNWRKSSYSGNGGSSCIEVASDGGVIVRDTTDRTGPVLRLSPAVWRRFADQVKRSLTPGADDEGPGRSHPDRAGAFAYWQLVLRRRHGRPGRVTIPHRPPHIGAAKLRRTLDFMEPASGGDRYITWLPHPDPLVEQMFRDADRAGYTIVQVKGVYMLVTPDVLDDYYFVGRVVPSSAAWRHMVRELQEWLDSTGRRAPGRQV